MSWRFPKFRFRTGQVPNVEDINRDFYPVAEEAAGRLNEHNWASAAITNRTQVEDDAVFVWHQAGYYADIDAGPWQATAFNDEFSVERIWRDLPNATVTFNSPGCLLWMHGTAQVTFNQSSGALHNNLFFALRIDGAVLPESIVGGVEPSQDKSPGLQNPAMPVGTSLVFPVAPGEHTVSLVVTIGKESGAAAYTNRTFIESRELIVLEMRR